MSRVEQTHCPEHAIAEVCGERGRLWAAVYPAVVVVGSIVRGVPLLWSARPGTPLRVMCIMAFDAVHVHRHGRRLPAERVRLLAAVLDAGALVNAALDGKRGGRRERQRVLNVLREGGIGASVAEYLRRLRGLERGRPVPGGDAARFVEVRRYREAVVRLSLGMLVVTAEGRGRIEEGIEATRKDADLDCLFRLAMQCQVIDDVVDYKADRAAGLPTLMTACGAMAEAVGRTRGVVEEYAGGGEAWRAGNWVLRWALGVVSGCARVVVGGGGGHSVQA